MYVKSLLLPAAATGRAIRSRGFVFITGTARVQRFQAHHVLFSSGFSGQSPSASEHPFSCFNLAAPVYAQDPFPPRRSRVLSLKTMSTSGGNVGQSPSSVVEFKTAKDVVDFWFGDLERFASDKEYASSVAGKWWGFGPTDEVFIASQMASKELIRKAASGELQGGSWEGPQGALAKIIVLDQFPRTVYRGTAQAFATDEIAATLALEVIANGWDKLGVNYTFAQRNFVYLPLMHSERLEAQEECVERCKVLVDEKAIVEGKADLGVYSMAKDHYDVISKFGRFPHRNSALGRTCTPDEEEWLSSDDIPGWAKSQEASASSA